MAACAQDHIFASEMPGVSHGRAQKVKIFNELVLDIGELG